MRLTAAALVVAALLALVNTGCQQMGRIFYVPGQQVSVVRDHERGRARLAGYAPMQDETAKATVGRAGDAETTGQADGAGESAAPTAPADREVVDADADSNGPASAHTGPQYSSPQFSLPQLVAAAGPWAVSQAMANANVAGVTGNALVSSPAGVVGRAGLTGSTATLGTTLVSRPGLQDGPATGLGFAIPGRNVFSRQANPLSGATGGCAALTRAGFFGGDRAVCERAGRK